MPTLPRSAASGASGVTSLPVVLAFVFVNSIGGGVVTTGFPFLAAEYGFTPGDNYLMGLGFGIVYILGALGVGPVIAKLAQTSRHLTPRSMMAALMLALGALCSVPLLADRLSHTERHASWPFWVLVLGYSLLTGVLWPIAESYMSGGRSGVKLRSAAGAFNVTWSGALVVAYLTMGPLIGGHTLEVILGVGVLHVSSLALLLAFAPVPAAHLHDDHEPAPPVYSRLLGVFRMQLPTSYLVYSALTPYLPIAFDSLGVGTGWATPVAATWLAARMLTFALLQRWHGWHGRWLTAWAGSFCLLVGFGMAVLSATIGQSAGREAGLAALVAGLAVFGVGMGVIYTSALYYAMAVGNAQVDAGGKHEALIGVGYGAGPICGLLALYVQQHGWLRTGRPLGGLLADRFEVAMLVLVAVVGVVIVAWSLLRASMHASRAAGISNPEPDGR